MKLLLFNYCIKIKKINLMSVAIHSQLHLLYANLLEILIVNIRGLLKNHLHQIISPVQPPKTMSIRVKTLRIHLMRHIDVL